MKGLYACIWLLLLGCTSVSEKQETTETIPVKYAKGFHFEVKNGKRFAVVDTPWPNASDPFSYELTQPIQRLVVTSTSHLPFLELLDAEDHVVGFPNLKYISSEVFIEKGENGELTDLGPDGQMNMELLMSVNPDAVIAFDMGGESQVLDKIKDVGIPVYYNSDFLESTPLGRAEWIRFFGALIDKEAEADSVFRAIEAEYLRVLQLASEVSFRPTVISGVVYGDTWFLPGGNNWSATFFESAGGQYVWEQDTTSGWMELSFEAAYEKGNEADFWIGTSTFNSRNELVAQEQRYQNFAAYQNDQVYSYHKIMGPNGGYDFFESGYSRPDLVLSDLIKILHPELLPDYETVYFEKLP